MELRSTCIYLDEVIGGIEAKLVLEGLNMGQEDIKAYTLQEYITVLSFELPQRKLYTM